MFGFLGAGVPVPAHGVKRQGWGCSLCGPPHPASGRKGLPCETMSTSGTFVATTEKTLPPKPLKVHGQIKPP